MGQLHRAYVLAAALVLLLTGEALARQPLVRQPLARQPHNARRRAVDGLRRSVSSLVARRASPQGRRARGVPRPGLRRVGGGIDRLAGWLHTRWAQRPPRQLSPRQARRYMQQVARKENRFYQPGVGYDGQTGLTFDGVNIDFNTGRPVSTRNHSAPSKESLHVAILVKALSGDRTAQTMISPDPRRPRLAEKRALEVLSSKIATYERFNREHSGFGGFLPWYTISGGKMQPIPSSPDGKAEGWETRVPALDNGQLAWSLYYASNTLESLGHKDLARRYRAHFDLMRKNVVQVFYDPAARKLRAEARLLRGNRRRPEQNAYALNKNNPYFLNDSYEGLMMCHFADLFGNWKGQARDKEAIWSQPRRKPAVYTTSCGKRITISQAWVGSSHEEWGELFLPFQSVGVARKLFLNSQRVRTIHSAENRIPGLFASTHRPIARTASPEYEGKMGYDGKQAAMERPASQGIVAPYAAFPLALVPRGKPQFATWLKTMLDGPRMLGPYGMGESASVRGDRMAPCLTWDGKALPMLAWMGGVRGEIRQYLARDGLYRPFVARVKADFRLFDSVPIEGSSVPIAAPTTRIPRAMSGFSRGLR